LKLTETGEKQQIYNKTETDKQR